MAKQPGGAQSAASAPPQRSLIYTVLLAIAALGMLAGIVVAVLGFFGVGTTTAFSASYDKAGVNTTSIGLGLLAVSAFFAYGITLALKPVGLQPFAKRTRTVAERVADNPGLLLGIGVVGIVLLILVRVLLH